jgi:hypothetical protein
VVRVEAAGTVALLVVTMVVVVAYGLASALAAAGEDLYAANDEARGTAIERPRSQPGIWLADRLARDLAPDDLEARNARADELSYRSERVREASGVGALLGVLIGVMTGRRSIDHEPRREASKPAPNTTSNGMA